MATFQPLLTPPDHVLLGAAHVGEEDLVELPGPVGLHDGPNLDPVLLHGDQEVRDALVLAGVGVGAGQQEDVVGVLGLGGPHLLAVDDPLVAVQLGLGLERGEIRAGLRFGEALAPGDLALEDLGQELLLLLLGPPLQDGRSDQGVAEEVGSHGGAGPGELLVEHHVLQGREALAAVLLRPGRADPAAVVELLHPLLVELLAIVTVQLEALLGTSRRAGCPPARLGSRPGTPRLQGDRSGPCPPS